MKRVFDILFEFDPQRLNNTIIDTIDQAKGYVCVIDGNVLANATKNLFYKDILNNALANSCDGSSIAKLAGIIHKQKFTTYTGPEIFSYFIQKNYKQMFLGNTTELLNRLNSKFERKGMDTSNMQFESLPFKAVDDFDYTSIAKNINAYSPDIIWVSLGAPKQEIFISKLYPFINKGILFAIGAAFNLYLNEKGYSRAPDWIQKIHMEWLYRSIKEPKRVGKRAFRYATVLPGIIIDEIITVRKNKNETIS